jgi:hypothetical protein
MLELVRPRWDAVDLTFTAANKWHPESHSLYGRQCIISKFVPLGWYIPPMGIPLLREGQVSVYGPEQSHNILVHLDRGRVEFWLGQRDQQRPCCSVGRPGGAGRCIVIMVVSKE